jgi:hypothetical protein
MAKRQVAHAVTAYGGKHLPRGPMVTSSMPLAGGGGMPHGSMQQVPVATGCSDMYHVSPGKVCHHPTTAFLTNYLRDGWRKWSIMLKKSFLATSERGVVTSHGQGQVHFGLFSSMIARKQKNLNNH